MHRAENHLPADVVGDLDAPYIVIGGERLAAGHRGVERAEFLFPRGCSLAIAEIESHGCALSFAVSAL
jgi:hypothetical protein